MNKPTSEQRYGLPNQPPDTCPMIDAVLADIDDLRPDFEGMDRSLMRRIDRARPDDEVANDMIDDLIYRLEQADEAKDNMDTGSIHRQMEKIRDNAYNIRLWGQAWKDEAKDALSKVERAKTLCGAIELWWSERDQDQLTCWLRAFWLDRMRKETYRVAI